MGCGRGRADSAALSTLAAAAAAEAARAGTCSAVSHAPMAALNMNLPAAYTRPRNQSEPPLRRTRDSQAGWARLHR